MILSPDELVGYLLESLAYNGDEGASIDELWSFALEKVESLDDFQKETIWQWLLAEGDHFVVAVDGNALGNDDLSTSLSELITKYEDKLQVYASEEDQWMLLTGQKKEENSLGIYPFQLLCAITRKRSRGATAVEIAKETGQDPRSLNSRVGKLLDLGLVHKRPIVSKGQNTSHLISTKFEPSEERTAYGEFGIDMRELARNIVSATRSAKNGLRQHDDLKLELGFDKTKRSHINFATQIRRLEEMGCVKRVWVTRTGSSDRFRCIKYVQDIPEDEDAGDSSGDDDNVFDEFKNGDEEDNEGPSQQPTHPTFNQDELENTTVDVEDTALSQKDLSRRTILFNTVYPLECQFYSMVNKGGEQGLPAMDMLKHLIGKGYHRIMARNLDFLIDKSPQKNGQPSHLGHYNVVRGIDTAGRTKFFRYFTQIGFSKFSGTALNSEWGQYPTENFKGAAPTLMALHKKASSILPGRIEISTEANGTTVAMFQRERTISTPKKGKTATSETRTPAKRGRPRKSLSALSSRVKAKPLTSSLSIEAVNTDIPAVIDVAESSTTAPHPALSTSVAVGVDTVQEIVAPKKKRGRPPKKQSDVQEKATPVSATQIVKRKRGRPRKYNSTNVLLTPEIAKSLLDSLVDSPMRAAAEPRLLSLHSQASVGPQRLASLSNSRQSLARPSSGKSSGTKPRKLVQTSLMSSLSAAPRPLSKESSSDNVQNSHSPTESSRSDNIPDESTHGDSSILTPVESSRSDNIPDESTHGDATIPGTPQEPPIRSASQLAVAPDIQELRSQHTSVHSSPSIRASPATLSSPVTPMQVSHPGFVMHSHPYQPHAMGRGFPPQMVHGSPPPPFGAVPPPGYPMQPMMSPYGSPPPPPQFGHPMGHHMQHQMPMYMGMPPPMPPHLSAIPMMPGQPPMHYYPGVGVPPPGFVPPPNAVPWGAIPGYDTGLSPQHAPLSQPVQRMDVDLTEDSDDAVVEKVTPVSTDKRETKSPVKIKEEVESLELTTKVISESIPEKEFSLPSKTITALPEVKHDEGDIRNEHAKTKPLPCVPVPQETLGGSINETSPGDVMDDEEPPVETIVDETIADDISLEPVAAEEPFNALDSSASTGNNGESSLSLNKSLLHVDEEPDVTKTPQPSSPLDKNLELDATTVINSATPQPEQAAKHLKPKLAPPPLTPRVSQTPEVSTPANMGFYSERASPSSTPSSRKETTETNALLKNGKPSVAKSASGSTPVTLRNSSVGGTPQVYQRIDWSKGKLGEPVFSMEPPEGHNSSKVNAKSAVDLSFASMRREKIILDLLKESEGLMEGGVVLSRRISVMNESDERMDRKTIDKTVRNMVLKGDVRQLFVTVPRVNGIHITKYLILDKDIDVNSKEVSDAKVAIAESLRGKRAIELSRNYEVEKSEFEYYTAARDGHFWSPTSKRIAYAATRYQDPTKKLRTVANQVKTRKPRGLLGDAIRNSLSEEAKAEAKAAKKAAAIKAKEERRAAKEALKAAKAAKAAEKAQYRKYYGPEAGHVQLTDKPRQRRTKKRKALPNKDPLYPMTDGLRKKMFNRRVHKPREDSSVPKEVKRRNKPVFRIKDMDRDTFFRIVVIVRSLYPRNRAINWEKVTEQLSSDYDVELAKSLWPRVRDSFGGRLWMEQAQRRWETLFLKGYENGDLPIITDEDNFDIPLYVRYWRKNERVLENTPELLATKEATLQEYDFYVTEKNEGLEAMYNAAAMTGKDEIMTNLALGYAGEEEGHEVTELSKAKQAIKAIIATDNSEYDANVSKRILDSLGEELCINAVKSLEQDRAIMCVAKERQNFIPGRNFMFSDRFQQTLYTKYNSSILGEATKFEENLVSALNSKKGLIMSRTASDSSMVSILDFITFGRVDLVRVNGTNLSLKDSYRTRALDKEKLDFDIVIKSKDSTAVMDLVVRPDVPVPLADEPCGTIWTSMVGTLSTKIWEDLVKTILWAIALRPGITIEAANARLLNITTYQEVEMIFNWLVARGAVEKIGEGGYIIKPRWYSSII
ncbi:hypothetical protein TRVA0_030S00672 [Trichomonascus vanleenenianus]|uniref:transcription factor TFIIIC subunit TFC3 n=1 Tax=Trichomonascus vanleenenianus TaxID=2268995 RepID=UPI003ECA1BD2